MEYDVSLQITIEHNLKIKYTRWENLLIQTETMNIVAYIKNWVSSIKTSCLKI